MPVDGLDRRIGLLFLASFARGLCCARGRLAFPGRDFRHQETLFLRALPEALVLLVAIGVACRTLQDLHRRSMCRDLRLGHEAVIGRLLTGRMDTTGQRE
jgi:hypothetical protein